MILKMLTSNGILLQTCIFQAGRSTMFYQNLHHRPRPAKAAGAPVCIIFICQRMSLCIPMLKPVMNHMQNWHPFPNNGRKETRICAFSIQMKAKPAPCFSQVDHFIFQEFVNAFLPQLVNFGTALYQWWSTGQCFARKMFIKGFSFLCHPIRHFTKIHSWSSFQGIPPNVSLSNLFLNAFRQNLWSPLSMLVSSEEWFPL